MVTVAQRQSGKHLHRICLPGPVVEGYLLIIDRSQVQILPVTSMGPDSEGYLANGSLLIICPRTRKLIGPELLGYPCKIKNQKQSLPDFY